MKFRYLSLILLICFSISEVKSEVYYVNGKTGNDLSDGKSEQAPLKTIQKAVSLAKGMDIIKVEGLHNGDEISYNECITLDETKFGVQLIGLNNPVLDGDFNSQLKTEDSEGIINTGIAISINAMQVTVTGFNIMNYTKQEKDSIGGIGILCIADASKITIYNMKISDCNYGIYLDGNSFCRVYGNKIQNIESYEFNDITLGGTGIMIDVNGIGIEENIIGGEEANEIFDTEKYGIQFGRKGKIGNADNSSIENNIIKNCEQAALAVFDIEGIVKIKNNAFIENNTSLAIYGMPIDTKIANNTFKGPDDACEIVTGPEYDGYLLYDIWQRNDNSFLYPSYAAVNKNEEVLINEYGAMICYDRDKVEEAAGEKYKIVEKK